MSEPQATRRSQPFLRQYRSPARLEARSQSEDSSRADTFAALPFILPFGAVYLALFVWPLLQTVLLSFSAADLLGQGEWVGLENYRELLTDRRFRTAILNTLWFVTLTVVPGGILALGLALLVHRLHGFFRTVALCVFFVPYILPVTTVTEFAAWLGQAPGGGLQPLIELLAGRQVPIWRTQSWLMPSLAVLTLWWTAGFNILLFLAALRNVPEELYEAAMLDGAGPWRRFRRITWPLIWPVTVLVLFLQLIMQLKVFDQVHIMVGGGRVDANLVLVQYIFNLAFQRNEGGYAATVAVVFLGLVFMVTATLQWQLRRARVAL